MQQSKANPIGLLQKDFSSTVAENVAAIYAPIENRQKQGSKWEGSRELLYM